MPAAVYLAAVFSQVPYRYRPAPPSLSTAPARASARRALSATSQARLRAKLPRWCGDKPGLPKTWTAGWSSWGWGKKEMTTQRAPYITRRWTETELAALRSMAQAGKDARVIGKELHRSFMGVQAKAKKLKITLPRVRTWSSPAY